MAKIVGIVGLLNSGKDTVASYLIQNFGYKKDSFASPLKDACASIFNWDRNKLEGVDAEGRAWREEVDEFWSTVLDDSNLTPRKVLQNVGTEVFRQNFHNDIWVLSLLKRVQDSEDKVVVTDCRFPNEIDAIREAGGVIIRVKRGPDPAWFGLAESNDYKTLNEMGIHASEYSWAACDFDYIIENNSSLEELREKVLEIGDKL